MKLSDAVFKNLNKIHWDRRPWQVGYRGPPLAQQKATGRPHIPIHKNVVNHLKHQLGREYQVMRYLASPYLEKNKEQPFIEKFGTVQEIAEKVKEEQKLSTMPGDPKAINDNGDAYKLYANYGNLMHKHRTVEDSMFLVVRRQRWD